MTRPIPQSRAYPTTWTENTLAGRGWAEHQRAATQDTHRLIAAAMFAGAAVTLAAVYGWVGFIVRHGETFGDDPR
jgi:hypothetical protein